MSWQPAFCEDRPNKPECAVTDVNSYQAGHFTLHGLWPNLKECGTHYGMCNREIARQNQFCAYPELGLSVPTRHQLEKYMPSTEHGSCLQRHEWFKHGTCQTHMDVDTYYDTAIKLLREFNTSKAAQLVKSHVGSYVQTELFLAAFDQSYGQDMHERLSLICRNGDLVDLYIRLHKDVRPGTTLKSLIESSQNTFTNNCGDRFKVDLIND